MESSRLIVRIVLTLFVACGLAPPGRGALQPEEIVIIGAQGNHESEGLAEYYVRARGVPEANICLVELPDSELLPRSMWQRRVRREIRKWLVEHDPQQKTRCLLTVWGVPLKIGPAAPNEQWRKYQRFLEAERAHRIELLSVVHKSLDEVAPNGELSRDDAAGDAATSPEATEGTTPSGGAGKQTSDLAQQRLQLERSLQAAQARLTKLAPGEARNRGQLQLHQLAAAAGGANVILQGLSKRIASNPDAASAVRSEFDALRGRAAAFAEVRLMLEQTPSSLERDAIQLAVLERIGGLLATVEWLDEQLKIVSRNESGASFDSELALVLWPDNYELLRWQPNYLRPAYDNSQLRTAYRTLMVSRLDAPTLALAKGLVDAAVKVEKEGGLRGKVYIDARGVGKLEDAAVRSDSYADYDRALLITAKGIEEQTDLEVVLDTSPQLFQAGECPDAALYCGWYSLAKYVDAFDWRPGAVAYHLASGEAQTLRDPASQAWCKKMLEDGVCATMGPVHEPYLASFPRPNEFFALLLQGELTLVECYARSKPYNSWMMTLIGDPLYRPFKYRVEARLPTEATESASGQSPEMRSVPLLDGSRN